VTKILLIDDDPYTQNLVAGLLRGGCRELQCALNVAQARQLFRASDFNLAIVDQRLPDGNGFDLFADMRRERPHQMAILITGYAEVRDAVRAVRAGLFDYLTKPFANLEELEAVIDKALEMDRAYREIATLQETLKARADIPALIGRSAVIEKLLQTLRQAAPLDTTILIEGESGTGKELFAQQIHALSRRAQGPMLELNCGALSESLLETTLFGYEKGAFTGAGKTTAGYFEEANGGTLLLDEVTDMSPKLQASLLRVLQEHKVRRVGENEDRPVDFVLVAATHQNLEQRVAAGMFRADLLFRIQGIRLDVPPLRERGDDVMLLAGLFLQRACQRMARTVPEWSDETQELLRRYRWPGNVRELLHVVERAALIADGGWIHPPHLPPEIAGEGGAVGEPGEPLDIHDHFRATVLKYQGAMGETELAKKLGISRKTLWERRKKMGIPRS